MGEGPLDKTIRTVYQKDLYDEKYSLNIRIDSDELEDGDQLRVVVDRIGNTHTNDGVHEGRGKHLQSNRDYKISKVVNGFVKWLKEKHNGL